MLRYLGKPREERFNAELAEEERRARGEEQHKSTARNGCATGILAAKDRIIGDGDGGGGDG